MKLCQLHFQRTWNLSKLLGSQATTGENLLTWSWIEIFVYLLKIVYTVADSKKRFLKLFDVTWFLFVAWNRHVFL